MLFGTWHCKKCDGVGGLFWVALHGHKRVDTHPGLDRKASTFWKRTGKR